VSPARRPFTNFSSFHGDGTNLGAGVPSHPRTPQPPGAAAEACLPTPVACIDAGAIDNADGIDCPSDTEEMPPVMEDVQHVEEDVDDPAAAEGSRAEPTATQTTAQKKAAGKKAEKAAEKLAQKRRLEDEWTEVLDKKDVNIDRAPFLGSVKGHPAGKAAALTAAALPLAYFDLYWSLNLRKKLCTSTNQYAAYMGAGSDDHYSAWKPFSLWEIERSLGFLIHQGFSPKPSWTAQFEDPDLQGSFGSEQMRRLYGDTNAA
jgi:hypothetical protein